MRRQGRKNRRIFGNGVTILGQVLVVALLAIVIFVRGNTLQKQNKNYLAMEESLEDELSKEELREKNLEDRRVYSKTKEYVMEEAREIFGLQMPDEIIVKPEN